MPSLLPVLGTFVSLQAHLLAGQPSVKQMPSKVCLAGRVSFCAYSLSFLAFSARRFAA